MRRVFVELKRRKYLLVLLPPAPLALNWQPFRYFSDMYDISICVWSAKKKGGPFFVDEGCVWQDGTHCCVYIDVWRIK